ncbi:hypothetical protein M404DRAFT_1001093 [Pisolithus tinctorius Marx 270]|uniref:Aminoglycoside phosphotransferase domain-containing protein n=1 Tax=Pisolithus tinctorius Marx 270 TaxID=870435 RepID=A0A0C3P7Y4_PISTI|nr:hypothetical protein M404DRAFT_1001093 [Pisolithus tinctorius Marx 270]
MDFDFTAYLAKLLYLPPNQITIQFLTGGFCNVTVRASFTPPADLTRFGHSKSVPSIVIKYAPPFMATDPSQPLNVIRQDIEARALLLLDPTSPTPLPVSSLLIKYPNFRIPRFIHHDVESSVLMMTDLGTAVATVDEWLSRDPPPTAEEVQRVASDLGQFLAEFVMATREPSADVLARAPNSAMVDQFYSDSLNITRTVLNRHGVSDAETLVRRVERAFRDADKTDRCLGMVDLWTSNILIDPDNNICLVDWEHFGLSNASCELSMLVQSFHWLLLRSDSTYDLTERTNAFTQTMLQNYALRTPPPSLPFKRYALLAYGCLTINILDFFKSEFNENMRQVALEAGVGYLRAAGESVETIDSSIFDGSDWQNLTPHERLYERGRLMMAAR